MRRPGIKPGSIACKATMLTITPATLTWGPQQSLGLLRKSNNMHETQEKPQTMVGVSTTCFDRLRKCNARD